MLKQGSFNLKLNSLQDGILHFAASFTCFAVGVGYIIMRHPVGSKVGERLSLVGILNNQKIVPHPDPAALSVFSWDFDHFVSG